MLSRLAAPVLAAALLAGCAHEMRPALPLRDWLSSDAARRTVSVRLVPGYNEAYGGFNFNGYGKGEVLVRVPVGWRVTVQCENVRSARRSSCAVVSGPGEVRPTFAGAASAQSRTGLRPGYSDSFSFKAAARGTYRLACLVPGHERAGEWDVFEVAKARRPSVVLLRTPA